MGLYIKSTKSIVRYQIKTIELHNNLNSSIYNKFGITLDNIFLSMYVGVSDISTPLIGTCRMCLISQFKQS